MSNPTPVIAYTRISEREQSRWSLSGQLQYIQEYAERNDMEVTHTFSDDGYSAKNFDRPGWKALLKQLKLKRNKAKIVVVYAYSRMIRNASDGLAMFDELKDRYGANVISVSEPIPLPLSSPIYFKFRADMLVNAEFERLVIGDRSAFGSWQAKRSGRWLGSAPIGYVNARDERDRPVIKIDEEKAHIVRQIFLDLDAGMTHVETDRRARAAGLGLTSHAPSKRIALNNVYAGLVNVPQYQDHPPQVVRGIHEPIISEELFYRVQRKLNLDPQARTWVDENVELRGYLRCEQCGEKLTGGRSKGRSKYYYYYKCRSCKGQNRSAPKVHRWIRALLDDMTFAAAEVEEFVNAANEEYNLLESQRTHREKALTKEVAEAQQRIDTLQEKYFEGKVTDEVYRKYNSKYQDEYHDKKRQLARLSTSVKDRRAQFDAYIEGITSLRRIYDGLPTEERRVLLELIFGAEMYLWEGGVRTANVLPQFLHKALNSNYLQLACNWSSAKMLEGIPTGTHDWSRTSTS